MRDAYRKHPDSALDADDWSTLEEFRPLGSSNIWCLNLPAPAGRRPVLLLSRNDAYQYLGKFVVAEITKTIRSISVEVRLGRREGLPSACVANLDNVRTVARP